MILRKDTSELPDTVPGSPEGDAAAPSANDWVYQIGEESPWMNMYLRDPYEYIQPEPVMAGRCVILAFDDLERTNLSQVELGGSLPQLR